MKVLDEFECPCCGKTIQHIQIRRPTTVRQKSDRSLSISTRRGVYEYRCKE